MKTKSIPRNIKVIYNPPTTGDRADVALLDADTARTAVSVWRALKNLGFDSEVVQIPFENLELLKKSKPDLVFNLCEWTGREIFKECELINYMEKIGQPYTGSGAGNYYVTTDKIAAKEEMDGLEIPTPQWQVFHTGDEALRLELFPLIVKPVYEHGSVGISQNSVVTEEGALRERVKHLIASYEQPVLAERFIAGRELKVTIVGNGSKALMLPLAEVVFAPDFNGRWKILTFPSKWMHETEEFRGSKTVCPPKGLSVAKVRELEQQMLLIYRKLGCRDYARYDVMFSDQGEVYILEVNSNPSLENEPGYGPILSAAKYGWNYEQLILEIVKAAWNRIQKQAEVTGVWEAI
jgi:D-alanine-D-alanine ligase